MGTNITGIGNANAIGFKSRVTGGIYFPPELKDALVGVWSAYGKSNDSTDRNIIKNKIKDRGGDFVISNAAFKLNSGFGGFVEDFTSWDRIDSSTAEISNDGSKIKCINTTLNVQYLFNYINRDISSFKVKISNFTKGDITYYYRKEDGIEAFFKITPLSVVNSDKVIELPKSYNTVENGTGSRGGFYSSNINIGVTIEQIPSFEGAFVTDGINDLITSTKTVQEMLGGSNEITVVSMIHGIGSKNAYTNVLREYGSNYIRNTSTADGKTGIYGYTCKDTTKSIITDILGDKNDYKLEHIQTTTSSTINSVFSVAGWRENNGSMIVYPVAWYWTIIANKVLTTDEINQVIAYYNLDRTLNPDILCNTIKQGITNENHAEFGDKLIDFSGNGRDIQLNNIAWKGDSGIGKYETDFTTWTRSHFTDEVNFTPSKIEVTGILTTNSILINNKPTPIYNVEIHSPNKSIVVYYQYNDDTGVKRIALVDGINELPSANDSLFVTSDRLNSKGITITQIPSHAGALCLDGVNDFGKVTGMPIYKDYTFIIDYERISYTSSEVWTASVVSKAHTVGQGAFILMLANREVELLRQSNSFGSTTTFNRDDFTRTLLYQSKYKCGDVNLTVGEGIDGDTLWLGTLRDNDYRFFNGAIYSLMSFPYSMSEFLIERQLKKYKLGTLYPDMVEFRPVIKTNTEWEYLEIYQGDNRLYNLSEHDDKTGIYLEENSSIEIYVKPYTGQKVSKIVYNGTSYIDLENNNYGYYYITVPVTKSPQKIGITIEQDENYVQWNPVVESNVEYQIVDCYIDTIPAIVGKYYLINSKLRVAITTKGAVDEVTQVTVGGVPLKLKSNIGNRFTFDGTLSNISPQKINIKIDEYIRYEDIVQPYPVLLRFNDENGNEVSWGGKFRVGSTITRIGSVIDSNLLPNIYNIFGLLFNDNQATSSKVIVEKTMIFKAKSAYIFDNNEPKVILSPRLLRIPNSSYKILGYIPDISGHGNHGKINNSAYAEGSGVNEDGSYQFDGVDDFVTIPTTVGGKQMLMKVNSFKINNVIYDQRNINNLDSTFCIVGNTYTAYITGNAGNTYIDGILNQNITGNSLINITHNITITNKYVTTSNSGIPNIGSQMKKEVFGKISLYDFMLFDKISTDDKIKELNEYVGIEAKVELPPYYWDTYGKTNLDADKATIQQRGVAVGDYDLTNTNFAYDKMSGFGGYEFEKFTDTTKWIETKREDGIEVIEKNDYSFTAKKVGTGQYFWDFKNNSIKTLDRDLTVKAISNNNVYIRWEFKYRTAEKPDIDSTIILLRQAMTPNVPITVTLPYKTQEEQTELGVVEGSTYYLFYFDPSYIPVGDEYTVEMLPLYPNGLVYDGVDDYSKNKNIPVLTDYTYIYKRTIINIPTNAATLLKGADKTNGGAFIADYGNKWQFNFGQYNTIQGIADGINWQTVNSFNGTSINKGKNTDDSGITVAKFSNGYTSMVFYKLILYPKTISLLEINFLKNLMEKDEIIDLNNPIFIKNE